MPVKMSVSRSEDGDVMLEFDGPVGRFHIPREQVAEFVEAVAGPMLDHMNAAAGQLADALDAGRKPPITSEQEAAVQLLETLIAPLDRPDLWARGWSVQGPWHGAEPPRKVFISHNRCTDLDDDGWADFVRRFVLTEPGK